jgi:hypothetical protein
MSIQLLSPFSTVRDLAAGSGIHFAARGKQKLRGVEGEYYLFAVED